MPDLIVIRLHPEKPIAGAEFTNYLDGLTITAYDLSTADPRIGQSVGSAAYVAPPNLATPWIPDPTTGMVQHFTVPVGSPPPPPVPEAVATAVIQISLPAGYKEYPASGAPDLRIEISRNGKPIFNKNLYYDAATVSAAMPPAANFPGFTANQVSLYLTLPHPLAAGLASLDLSDDGTPPNYKALKDAVTTVLNADQQPNPPAVLGNLTPEQARHIAYEIIWGPQDPLPAPPSGTGSDDLSPLYTNPPNDGSSSNTAEQNRQQFEGNLSSYYAIHNANVDRLARYIMALSAAVACEDLSSSIKSAFLQFPVQPGAAGSQATISTAEVLLVDSADSGSPLVPAFLVPAEYFYVLGVQLPMQMAADQRLLMACRDTQERLLAALTTAVDDGTIDPVPAVNPAQAVRRLTALRPVPDASAPHCKSDASVLPLVNDWLAFPNAAGWRAYRPGDDPDSFWEPEFTAQPLPYLHLVLCALTNGYQQLIDAVIAIPINSVTALAAMTETQWRNLFGIPPNALLLPPFTAPGTLEARVTAFIRRVQKFFAMTLGASPLPSAAADPAPTLDLPTVDVIAQFVTEYQALTGGPFTFGSGPLNETDVVTAAQSVFPGDTAAQSWLNQRVHVINELCMLAGVVSNATPPVLDTAFSIAEALYARGFTSVEDVQSLSLAEFADALRGTVAFSAAATIYARAGAAGSQQPPTPGAFQPINPGSLVNCVPPCYLSPLGPVEYLHELLELSESSTCETPSAPPAAQKKRLSDVIAARRGALGDLSVSAANADTPIPLIDIVNENLENLAATLPALPKGIIYDTATDKVANHTLCAPGTGPSDNCHVPEELLEALPEHSSPAVPVGQPQAYDRLKSDFSAPTLPYSQPLDISRTYLDHVATRRYETMRTFRKEITEFTLDPSLSGSIFQSHLWRYPVRIDIATEYLQINPEEYELLFSKDIADAPTPGHLVLYELYGFDTPDPGGMDWVDIVLLLPEFLKRTGLTYCELVDLQKSACFPFEAEPSRFRRGDEAIATGEAEARGILPDCESCCPEDYTIRFVDVPDQKEALRKLVVFLRVWRKLQDVCGARYTFTQLCDICEVLQLFNGASVNPDFVRQLAAFQMLRDEFELELTDGTAATGAHGADRTPILALWVGPSAAKWNWAFEHLLDRIQHFVKRHHNGRDRTPHFVKLLTSNLDPLSVLAGFDPSVPSDTWHTRPTNTLRFAEVLAKICASRFGVGELLYLFTADDHLNGDDPFPLQDANEALDSPLELPDDERAHDLWVLRDRLLSVEVTEDETHEWNWQRMEAVLRSEFGYEVPAGGTDHLASLGQHFFPTILEHAGLTVTMKDRQYREDLAAPSPEMWNTPPEGPFRYDSTASQLWTQLPLRDAAVVDKLEHLRELTAAEQLAVQNLYYQPRVDLAPFACFFPGLASAEEHLIEEADETERWDWFRRQFVLTYKRCRVITEHLVDHIVAATDGEWPGGYSTAWLILKHLFADENRAVSTWEADSGARPDLTWTTLPSGGAFAALLGLTGTGLLGELSHADGKLAWRAVHGPMSAFGHEKNEQNCPVPAILPAPGLSLTADQMKYVELRNGFAIEDRQGRELGGAEGFSVKWSGVMLVDEEGHYEFTAGAPTPEGQQPDFERAEHARWRVSLTRGQKTWIVLSHQWPDEHGRIESSISLKSGAYGIVVEFVQPAPDFSRVDDIYRQHTGFQVKYTGPDTQGQHETLPLHRLYRDFKDDTLDTGIEFPQTSAAGLFLKLLYTSTLRDIRRTYQRAFKALLFAHRFELSGHPVAPYQQSELGYMLDRADRFAGISYFRNPTVFARHAANFDFNFLPLKDQYHPPSAAQDQRVQPSPKREQALFDWWERIFDYTQMRRERSRATEHPVWLLFEEALEKQPDNPAQLLRHMGVDFRHAALVLTYFQNQAAPVYSVSFSDLEDDRWAVRAWHGDQWIRHLVYHFTPKEISTARPDLWASDDPLDLVTGETELGNASLSRFLCDGYFETGEPRRYADVKLINDRLREHARSALLVYLCAMDRVPLPWGGTARDARDLSALLLLDVETGLCESASRVEEAITAVQNFIQRARMGLEAGWTMTAEFVHLWKHQFETFRVWEKCKCRSLYRENWIEWDDLPKARKMEAFQFLEAELRHSTLTIAVPGGLEYWPETLPPIHPAVQLLQRRDASALRLLNPPREGLGVSGTPERDAQLSWLAPNLDQVRDQPPPDETGPVILATAPGHGTELGDTTKWPLWIQAAIRLGVKFIRLAAAGEPPAAAAFQPSRFHEESNCCNECGCVHPPLVDEYYFWLINARVFNEVEQDEYYDPTVQISPPWHNPEKLPALLDWKSAAAVRLAWCRVHNGEFKQPRYSDEVVQITPGISPDLGYVGRLGDSLTFSISTGIAPIGYAGTDAPGFRYVIATDRCVALPLVADPPLAITYPAGLPVYPYFAFVEPGDRLFPGSLFSAAILVANVLRCHCHFEPALKWYQLALNPLTTNNVWVDCGEDAPPPPDIILNTLVESASVGEPGPVTPTGTAIVPPMLCCDSTQISTETAHDRAILLHYLETLLEWAHNLTSQNSRESAGQARLVLDTAAKILGPCPRTVENDEPLKPATVATFVPLIPPLNPRLLDLYEHVNDELALLHRCLSEARLRNSSKVCQSPYWGQEPCHCGTFGQHCGCDATVDTCRDEGCRPHSPYRFAFLLQKAQEAAAKTRELGSALTSALERGDAEYLASMRARHEADLADLTIRVRQDQWREADWQVQALGKTKEVSQTNRRYYKHLIDLGLNNGENSYQDNTNLSIDRRSEAIDVETVGEALRQIPDLFIGFPSNLSWIPLGTKMGGMFEALARIINERAEIQGITASLNLTQAGWQRRLDEWVHQVEILDIEIEQIEIQILAAERRKSQALEELNIQQRQLEQAREVLDSLRDKFTNHDLYLYLQKETAALYWKSYEMARALTQEAQRALNFELGYANHNFLDHAVRGDLRQGLLMGEQLQLTLQHLENEYVQCDRREYELTKHISLAMHFPLQFLQLKTTGSCEIEIPEWMFDLDYPGQYMRRIKSVSLTIPCVTGPYTGVHCRLTLLRSQTRVDPSLPCPGADCCPDHPTHSCACGHEAGEHYEITQDDRRMVKHYGAREAIATSSGQNDAGLFELNFRDERHLPFEYFGAVSCWRIELPPENNYFDMESLADVVLHMNYTAREGGDVLRDAARASARRKLPGDGWIFIDLRRDFPDLWEQFSRSRKEHTLERSMTLKMTRKLFPFLPGDPDLRITKTAILFEMQEDHERAHPEIHGCPCEHDGTRDSRLVEVTVDQPDDDRDDTNEVEIICTASEDWPHLYHGVGDVEINRIGKGHDHHEMVLTFRDCDDELIRVFLLCHYEVVDECCNVLRPAK